MKRKAVLLGAAFLLSLLYQVIYDTINSSYKDKNYNQIHKSLRQGARGTSIPDRRYNSPQALWSRSGDIPEPTVKSGWEKTVYW